MTSLSQNARSAMSGEHDGASADAIHLAARAALLRCTRSGTMPQDIVDCARLLDAVALPDAARVLRCIVSISEGVVPNAAVPGGTGAAAGQSRPLDLMVDELRTLIALPPDPEPSLGDPGALPPAPNGHPIAVTIPSGVQADPIVISEMTDLVGRLHRGLAEPALAEVKAALVRIHASILHRPAYFVADYGLADIDSLAAMLASNFLRDFFILHYDLCWGKWGSAELFTAAARLQAGGLGAYLRNVPRMIASPRDVIGLSRLAHGQDLPARAAILQRSVILLSTHLDQRERSALADELGDRSMTAALGGLLMAEQRCNGHTPVLRWAIRDAALDNGEHALAIWAHKAILLDNIHSATEWIVLGELLGTAGDMAAAESAFLKALSLSPTDKTAAERLVAVRADSFDDFRVERGFGTPPWRSLARRTRRRLQGEPDIDELAGSAEPPRPERHLRT